MVHILYYSLSTLHSWNTSQWVFCLLLERSQFYSSNVEHQALVLFLHSTVWCSTVKWLPTLEVVNLATKLSRLLKCKVLMNSYCDQLSKRNAYTFPETGQNLCQRRNRISNSVLWNITVYMMLFLWQNVNN